MRNGDNRDMCVSYYDLSEFSKQHSLQWFCEEIHQNDMCLKILDINFFLFTLSVTKKHQISICPDFPVHEFLPFFSMQIPL